MTLTSSRPTTQNAQPTMTAAVVRMQLVGGHSSARTEGTGACVNLRGGSIEAGVLPRV